MLQSYIIEPNKMGRIVECEDFSDLLGELKIVDEFETYECGLKGIGIIAHDQDKAEGLKENRLGLRGAYAFIGMERQGDATFFTGLTREDVSGIVWGMAKYYLSK